MTELATRQNTLELAAPAYELAQRISQTEFVPKQLRGRPEAVMACILVGQEIGIPPMSSLGKIHMVDGRPSMAAELMRAIVLRAGHHIWTDEMSQHRCVMCGRRAGQTEVTKVTWDMEDARRAGLAGKQNWRSYPRQMLAARATGELCRLLFPDVLGGISYTQEEAGDIGDDEWGQPPENLDDMPQPEPEAQPKPKTRQRQRKSATPPPKPIPAAPAPKAKAERQAPPQPPLPGEDDDVIEAELVDEQEPKPSISHAQHIIVRCHTLGIDDDTRHGLIQQLTKGRTRSFTDCTDGELNIFEAALDRLSAGHYQLTHDPDGHPHLGPAETP